MNKVKGWKTEKKIDDYLHCDKVRSSMCEPARILIRAKTLITSLRKENKELRNDFEQYVDPHDFLYKCLLHALKKNTTQDVYEKELNEIQKKLKEKYNYIFGE